MEEAVLEALLANGTTVASPALCPEIRLHLARDVEAVRAAQEHALGRAGLGPAFWALAWPGGQAIARYLLDHPAIVAGRSVLDLGAGSGLCAIAAARAGARVAAADIDPFARAAIAANARLNAVEVAILADDVLAAPCRWEVILAGDLWYERFFAQAAAGWLRAAAQAGALVLAGDCGRAFLPRGGVQRLAAYPLRDAAAVEAAAVVEASVWRMGG